MDDLEAIKRNWESFKTAVGKLSYGDRASFLAVNRTLGYNAAKAVPALVRGIERAEVAEAQASRLLDEARATIQQNLVTIHGLETEGAGVSS